jgi:hypothetical protein
MAKSFQQILTKIALKIHTYWHDWGSQVKVKVQEQNLDLFKEIFRWSITTPDNCFLNVPSDLTF